MLHSRVHFFLGLGGLKKNSFWNNFFFIYIQIQHKFKTFKDPYWLIPSKAIRFALFSALSIMKNENLKYKKTIQLQLQKPICILICGFCYLIETIPLFIIFYKNKIANQCTLWWMPIQSLNLHKSAGTLS